MMRVPARGPLGRGDPDRYLLPTEVQKIRTRRHFMILMPPVLETLGVIAAALMIGYLLDFPGWLSVVVLIVVIGASVRMAWIAIEWWLERLVVTNHRLLLTSGVITRKVAMMPLAKVTDMTYEKPLLGQILGYGTFIVESAGQDQALSRIDYLPRADKQYLTISGLLFNPGASEQSEEAPGDTSEDESSVGPSTSAGVSPTDQADMDTARVPRIDFGEGAPPPGGPTLATPIDTPLDPDSPESAGMAGRPSPVQENPSSKWARRSRLGL